jgi:hypothetical protein
MKKGGDEFSDDEAQRRADATLKRLLATAPQPKTNPMPNASPKKRGRPAKVKTEAQENS